MTLESNGSLDVMLLRKTPALKPCAECGHSHACTEMVTLWCGSVAHLHAAAAVEYGIHRAIWAPGKLDPPARYGIDITHALRYAIRKLRDASNDQSSLNSLIDPLGPFVREYMDACDKHPDALVKVIW